MNNTELTLEQLARNATTCYACGESKSQGLVVCWHCFKYTKSFTPLKYSNLEFNEWLVSTKKGKDL